MIVLLMGYARVGKDLAAAGLKDFKRMAFADELKRDADKMLATIGIKSDWNDSIFKERWRPLLVALGAGVRDTEPMQWIIRLADQILDEEDIIITDGRYKNEVDWVLAAGGVVIRIFRPGYFPANDEERRSFAEIDTAYPDCNCVINYGTPEQLSAKVRAVIDGFRNG